MIRFLFSVVMVLPLLWCLLELVRMIRRSHS